MILLEIDSPWTWSHFFFGLTYATIASLFFLFVVLFLFKPKVRVAQFICHCINHNESYYTFKFVNVSYLPAHDVRVELHKVRKIPMGNGRINNEYERITLVNGDIFHIKGRPLFWRQNENNLHCVIVRSFENINGILDEEMNAIMIRVSLKHGLTGLSKVFEHEYANIQDIHKGKFKPGTKFVSI